MGRAKTQATEAAEEALEPSFVDHMTPRSAQAR